MDAEGRTDPEFYEAEVIDGELVETEVIELTVTQGGSPTSSGRADITRGPVPKLQTAAAAATGFVAGAATLALLRRYGLGRLERAASTQEQRPAELRRPIGWPPAQGTTYIVHVRPLTRPE